MTDEELIGESRPVAASRSRVVRGTRRRQNVNVINRQQSSSPAATGEPRALTPPEAVLAPPLWGDSAWGPGVSEGGRSPYFL